MNRERLAIKAISRLSNWILVGISTCLAVLLIFLVATRGMALSYAVVGVIAVGLFAARWLNASVKINLALVTVSSLVALYACEIVLGIADSHRANFAVTRWLHFPMDATPQSAQARLNHNADAKPTFDRRDKLQVIHDLGQQGVTAYPAVVPHDILRWAPPPGEFKVLRALPMGNDKELLPLGGVSNVLTVFCNESGEYVTYPSDEHGFHNPSGLWKNQQLEIVAVGDSFTHGACVPSGDNFVGVIRAHYPATANLGMDSNGPLLMLASLKEYALRFRPKTVLWFYFEGNDLKDLEHERHSPLLMSYMRGGKHQQLLDRQDEIDQKLKTYTEQVRRNLGVRIAWEPTAKLQHVRQVLARYAGDAAPANSRKTSTYFSSQVSEEEMDRFRSVLVEAASTVHVWGGTLYFIYLPEWARYGHFEFANKNRDRVLRLVKDLNLPYIDLHPVFVKSPDPVGLFPFRQSNHYSSEGHRLVGEEVLRVLHETDAVARRKRT